VSELWSNRGIVDAANEGDTGAVIRIARKELGRSQTDVGAECGYSQSVISRIERGQRHAYDIRILRRVSDVLGLPPRLLGLSEATDDHTPAPVNRRDLLRGAAGVAATTILPTPLPPAGAVAENIRHVTAAQRRLDGTMAARDLVEPVLAHLRLSARTVTTPGLGDRTGLAAAVSEAAGFAGWLHWDMDDLGSARRYYGMAISAAREARDNVLGAYMTGSLAAFLADQGDTDDALSKVGAAHQQLGADPPAIAAAWLSAVAALAHASAKDERATYVALERSQVAAERQSGEAPAWPWVFAFDPARVAAYRLACSVRLGRPATAIDAAKAAGPLLTAPTRQVALWQLDHADAHLQAGHVDHAFSLATGALATTPAQHSARIVNRARHLRSRHSDTKPCSAVRAFDDRVRSTPL
jgi:transcriptional regulator with XRE-family HTH domain